MKKSKKLIYGVGINDVDIILRNNPLLLKRYHHWHSMLKRCYSKNKDQASYNGYTVCEEWYKFSAFNKWMENNEMPNSQLDKDILFKNNKIYSPQTCCFVPLQINSLLIKQKSRRGELPIGVHKTQSGNYAAFYKNNRIKIHIGVFKTPQLAFNAYKKAKEQHIKNVATIYYKDKKISKNVYDALMAYEIDIND